MISINDFRNGFMVEEGNHFKSLNLRFNDAKFCDYWGLDGSHGISAYIDEDFLDEEYNPQQDTVKITFDIEFGFYDIDDRDIALRKHILDFKEVAESFKNGNALEAGIGVSGNYDFLNFASSMSHLVRCIQTEILQQNFDDWKITGARLVENNYDLWEEDSSMFGGRMFVIRTSAEVKL